jgi:hypothetical protein
VLASIAISTTKERRAMADGVRRREEVLPPGVRGEDAITPKPPKYRYSMEEDTELTMEDKEKMNQEEEDYAAYSQDIELSCRVRFEQRSKCLFNLLHIHADSLPCTISC